jgi:hypothetical protein
VVEFRRTYQQVAAVGAVSHSRVIAPSGANMEHADLTDAAYDAATRWPEGFDPEEHGAIRK